MWWGLRHECGATARVNEGFQVDAGHFGSGEIAGAGVGAADGSGARGDVGGGVVFARGLEDCDYGDWGIAAFGLSAALCAGGERDELLDRGDCGAAALPGTDLRWRGGCDFFAVGGID